MIPINESVCFPWISRFCTIIAELALWDCLSPINTLILMQRQDFQHELFMSIRSIRQRSSPSGEPILRCCGNQTLLGFQANGSREARLTHCPYPRYRRQLECLAYVQELRSSCMLLESCRSNRKKWILWKAYRQSSLHLWWAFHFSFRGYSRVRSRWLPSWWTCRCWCSWWLNHSQTSACQQRIPMYNYHSSCHKKLSDRRMTSSSRRCQMECSNKRSVPSLPPVKPLRTGDISLLLLWTSREGKVFNDNSKAVRFVAP